MSLALRSAKGRALSFAELDRNFQYLLDAMMGLAALYDLEKAGSGPGADRILFWDESAELIKMLSLGTGLSISATTLGLAAMLQSLAGLSDPGANRELRWNDTSNALEFFDAGTLYVPKSLFNANTILAATTDDTPAALEVAASRIVGRKATGDIAALTTAEVEALLTGLAKLTGGTFTGSIIVQPASAIAVVSAVSAAATDARFQAAISGAGVWYFGIDATDNQFKFDWNTSDFASPTMMLSTTAIMPGADDAIDLGSSSYRFDDVYATNSTIQTSDEREKKDIKSSTLGLDFIKRLRPVEYKWKDRVIPAHEEEREDEKGKKTKVQVAEKIITHIRPHQGFLAQEVKTAMDAAGVADFAGYIHDAETDRQGLRYAEFIGPMVLAMQELSAQNAALTARVEALEAGKEKGKG